MAASVVGVFASKIRSADFPFGAAPTGYAREAVNGRVRIDPRGVAGDEIADPRSLGRENHAIYLFNRDHYAHFETLLGKTLRPGIFAENLTYVGPDERELRIGDEIEVGSVRLKLTTPRIPCYKLRHFTGADQGFPAAFSRSDRTGVYARVLSGGDVAAGDPLALVRSNAGNATIAQLNAALTRFDCDAGLLSRVLASPDLLPGAADAIRRRMAENQPELLAQPVTARITRWRRLSHDVTELEIAAPPGADLAWKPGQFLTLGVPIGSDGPVFRCYSLTAGPPQSPFTVAVRREEAGDRRTSVSGHLFANDMTGSEVTLYPPSGSFCLPDAPTEPLTYIAGGIGITPILSHLRHLAREGAWRPVRLVYVCRDLASAVFHDELAALADRWDGFSYTLCLTRDGGGPDRADGHVAGRPPIERIVAEAPLDAPVYACGPPGLVHAVRAAHERRGRRNGTLFFELFEADGASGDVAEAVPRATMRLAEAGICGTWTPDEGTLLDWIVAATPFRPPAACRSGLCRTCMAALTGGTVAYPAGVGAPGHDRVLLCCARPASEEIEIALPAGTRRVDCETMPDGEDIQ